MSIYRSNNPQDFAAVDGIVIDESAPAPSIQGVGTGIAILVGSFERGPINELVEPGGQARIAEMFGTKSSGYNALRNKRFSRLKIVRANPSGGVRATVTLQTDGNADAVRLTAVDAGVAGNDIEVGVQDNGSGGYLILIDSGDESESYDIADNAALVAALANSPLVTAESLGNGIPADINTNLAGGVDPVASDQDYINALKAAEVEAAGNILFLDSYNANRNAALLVHAGLTRDKIVICAGPEDETVAEVVEAVKTLRDADGRIIYADNWLETGLDGVNTFVSPASFMASLISQTSAHIDPAFSGNTQFLYGVRRTKRQLTRADSIQLLEAGVASFEFDSDIGFKIKSGVVTQIADSAKRTILRRRMADFLTASIGRFLKVYQNAVNSLDNREAVKASILDFIQGQENLGVLPRHTEVMGGDAHLVDIVTPNTDQTIAEGKFFISYRQRIFSSMRFIVLRAEIGEGVVVVEEA